MRALSPAKNNTKYTSGQHLGPYVWATRALSLAINNTKYTSELHIWSYLLALRALSLAKNNTKYTSGQHIGSYVWATRTLSLAKKQYKVPKLDHARAPRDHCQIVFDMDGGGAGIWPSVCRPTRYHDGHTSRLRIGFRHGWWGPTCIPMCAVTCAGAPGTRCARPAHGTPGAAGACGTLGARGARGASGAPGVPGTLGPQRRAHGVGSGPQ